jgi:hypothetical protein
MNFKTAKWEEWKNDYSVAKMAFGIQLTVTKSKDKWIWQMGNLSFVFNQGEVKNEFVAKANAEHAFHLYVQENIEKCIEDDRP